MRDFLVTDKPVGYTGGKRSFEVNFSNSNGDLRKFIKIDIISYRNDADIIFREDLIMTAVTGTTIQSSTAMHNLYSASKKPTTGYNTAAYSQKAKNVDAGARASGSLTAYSSNNTILEQMACQRKSIPTIYDSELSNSCIISRGVTKVSEWPQEETLDPVFITYNSGLTGYDTVEYYYNLSGDEDYPTLYMRTKSGKEENYYKLDLSSINPSTATKAELLGYYSYQEYKGEAVNMYQLMADMDMAEHNGDVKAGDNLQDAFLKYVDNWLKALHNVFNIQKGAGDSKGAAATQGLLHFMNNNQTINEKLLQQLF